MTESTGRLVVAITGASGAPYAIRFLQQAATLYSEVYVMLTEQAVQVIAVETGRAVSLNKLTSESLLGADYPSIRFADRKNFFTPPASGSFRHDGMVIVPCSMGTASRIAAGSSDDLISRAADVCLKERRRLIIVPRETPWNLLHLRNMVTLTEAGATILPAAPAFYHNPKSINDLVDFVVARILQQLDAPQRLVGEWQVEAR